MTQVTAEMVKQLRDRTGVGMGKCKKALDEAGGNIDQAIDLLRKAGMASAVKKESRETNEGMIGFAETDSMIALVEVNAETDFVVQNENFQNFVRTVCDAAVREKPSSLDDFLNVKLDNGSTVEEFRAEHIQSLGENIRIKRIHILNKDANNSYGLYSHMGGKIVSLVELSGGNSAEAIAKEVAMHVAAEAPEFLSADEIPADVKAREEEIAKEQVKGKPENIIDKIVQGKLNAFYDAVCLPRQKFVKDPSQSVENFVAAQGKNMGADLKIKSFLRWQIGE